MPSGGSDQLTGTECDRSSASLVVTSNDHTVTPDASVLRSTTDDTAPWTTTTTIVPRAHAHQAVAELKDQPGRDILMFGSRTLWNDLLVAGLVDELHLMVGAAVLGGGTPAFGAGPVPPLRLVDTRRRDASDNLLVRYKVVGRDS